MLLIVFVENCWGKRSGIEIKWVQKLKTRKFTQIKRVKIQIKTRETLKFLKKKISNIKKCDLFPCRMASDLTFQDKPWKIISWVYREAYITGKRANEKHKLNKKIALDVDDAKKRKRICKWIMEKSSHKNQLIFFRLSIFLFLLASCTLREKRPCNKLINMLEFENMVNKKWIYNFPCHHKLEQLTFFWMKFCAVYFMVNEAKHFLHVCTNARYQNSSSWTSWSST